jgi:isopentenyl diphosphate isomerase/L-lactate dehydrogenase-like FMN-dependent dehydrogenase
MSDTAIPPPSQQPAGIPPEIRCARDYETLARRLLPAPTHAYLSGGSGHDRTANANLAASAQWDIYPRLLREVGAGHTGITLDGVAYAHPLFLSPVAFHTLAHPGAELETARGAHAVDACLIASSQSTRTLEEIAAVAGPRRWFQMYLQPRREDTLDLLRRAERAGYRAIVLTLDAPLQAPSLRTLEAGFQLPPDCVAANLRGYAPPSAAPGPGLGGSRIFQHMRGAPTWDDVRWLLQQTTLPVWAKGVLHADDAVALRGAGVAGIVVSNHGGRSLDGAPASLDVLPEVRAALGPDFPLLFDGGVRSGADAFKALALGANAVGVGRLQLYALAVAGALGVAHMMTLLREELELCMALAGCAGVDQITRACLRQTRSQPC